MFRKDKSASKVNKERKKCHCLLCFAFWGHGSVFFGHFKSFRGSFAKLIVRIHFL